MHFSNTVVIARPVHHVFGYVSDLEHLPEWNYAISETRKTSDGPIGPGTTYRQLRTIPRPSEETLRITEFEPDQRFAVAGRLGPLSGTLEYRFEPWGSATRLTNTADLTAGGIARLAEPLATSRVRDAVAANLETLKQLLESR